MDIKDRLIQVSEHIKSIGIISYLFHPDMPFAYTPYKNAFETRMWTCNGYYNSPIGYFPIEVRIELGEYFTKIELCNQYRVIYKQVIDIEV